jgi:hypothetical protein
VGVDRLSGWRRGEAVRWRSGARCHRVHVCTCETQRTSAGAPVSCGCNFDGGTPLRYCMEIAEGRRTVMRDIVRIGEAERVVWLGGCRRCGARRHGCG